MSVNDKEIELLELYLDHELSEADARGLDARLAVDVDLQRALDELRGQRALRLTAMSTAYDTDAASIERLVASVRTARASETVRLRRAWSLPRSAFSAAACVAFGLILGVVLQRQHAPTGGIVATPMTNSGGAFAGTTIGLNADQLRAHGAYVVSVLDRDGREIMRCRFHTPEAAQSFMQTMNRRAAAGQPVQVGDARILDEPF